MESVADNTTDAAPGGAPLEHLAGLLPVIDLTGAILEGALPSRTVFTTKGRESCGEVSKRLFRSHAGHVLLTGRKGAGRRRWCGSSPSTVGYALRTLRCFQGCTRNRGALR